MLTFKSVRLADGSRVTFDARALAVGTAQMPEEPVATATTQNQKFRVAIEGGPRWQDRSSSWQFKAYLEDTATGTIAAFRINADPSGAFPDQRPSVDFVVKDGEDVLGDGEVAIFVGSAEPASPLAIVQVDGHDAGRAVDVNVAVGEDLWVVVAAVPTSPGVELPDDPLRVVPRQSAHWEVSPQLEGNIGAQRLSGSQRVRVRVPLRPKWREALWLASQPETSAGKPQAHSTLDFELTYSSLATGKTHVSALSVPIRFRPSLVNVLMAMVGGALLGTLLPLVTPKSGVRWVHWPRAMIAALLWATFAEILGAVMLRTNSHVILFGFEIHPFDVLSAGLVGCLVGMVSFAGADWTMERLTKLGLPVPKKAG